VRRPNRAALAVALIALGAGALAAAPGGASGPAGAPFPSTGTYEGRVHPSGQLIARGLDCNLVGGELTCFDGETQARNAAASTMQPFRADLCSAPLTVWWDGGFEGGSLSYYDFPGWQDLPPGWGGSTPQVSSWRAGCRPARLSAAGDGAPPWISLPAGGRQDVMPPGWNDRAVAVFRG